jgi:hypothetical protein
MPGQLGTDFYRMVLERARDLLTALHKEVLQQENDSGVHEIGSFQTKNERK